MPTGRGVDVHPFYQRGAQLDGVEYLWIKMTDGARVYTKTYQGVVYRADTLAAQARQRGIPLGGYVYAQPGDGATEASVLWGECQRLGGTSVAPGCDIESDPNIHTWSKAEAADHGRAFCSWFRARGIRPAIYMGAAFAQQVRPDLWPENPVIWVARYGAQPEARGSGQYLGRYDVHQYTSGGTLPGSAGAVDWNQAYTTAHLTQPQEDDVFDEAAFNDFMWKYRFDDDGKGHTGNFAQAIKGMRDTLGQLVGLVSKGSGATAADVAAALLPALTAAMVAEVAKVDAISDADAEQIAEAVTARAGALLAGGAA